MARTLGRETAGASLAALTAGGAALRPLLTRDEARALDAFARDALGLPTVVLMESAGRAAYSFACRRYPAGLARVCVVGGVGQNGGDGWVVARFLHVAGSDVRAVCVGDPTRIEGDAATQYRALRALGIEVRVGLDAAALEGATLVVDALFGTGLSRPPAGEHLAAIDLMTSAGPPVLALDVPSGVDADTGAVLGAAVRADATVTFGADKLGLWQPPAREHAGHVEVASLGVPSATIPAAWLLDAGAISALVPRRPTAAHKGDAGHVVVVAGSDDTPGAALLAGLGALYAGSGWVTVASRAPLIAAPPELMRFDLAGKTPPDVLDFARGKRSVVLGPGLGRDAHARALVTELARELEVPTVLDADALSIVADDGLETLQSARGARVLTPHPGEAARLLGVETVEVVRDRPAAARRLAERSGQVVVLKGAGTIVTQPDGPLLVSPIAHSALGAAGTGDVLSGVVGALLGQTSALEAAAAAVLWHGGAAIVAAESDRGLLPSELARALPRTLERARAGANR